jgi:phage tail-like protein
MGVENPPLNSPQNPPQSFSFSLRFLNDPTVVAVFSEVSGLGEEGKVLSFPEGGEGRQMHRLPERVSSHPLVLKRGIVGDAHGSFARWIMDTVRSGLGNAITVHDLELELLGPEENVMATWAFYGAYPVQYRVSHLDAMSSATGMETVEFAYARFERVT